MVSQSHYLTRLALDENPFPVVPDANNFYLPKHMNTVIHEVVHVIEARKGFAVVTGEIGLGKTTMSRVLLGKLNASETSTALVFNTIVQGEMLLAEINKDFGLTVEDSSFSGQMDALNNHLLACSADERNCAIVIDDAQNLSIESLEIIRQISSLESDRHKLVQILLIGQPELKEKLELHQLRQLKSRIAYQAEVTAYSLEETKHYIHFKLSAAGNKGTIQVPEPSIREVHRISGGSPRLINLLMDRYLYALVAYECNMLDGKGVRAIAVEAGFDKQQRPWSLNMNRMGWLVAASLAAVTGIVLLQEPLKERAISFFTPDSPALIANAMPTAPSEHAINDDIDDVKQALLSSSASDEDMSPLQDQALLHFLDAYQMQAYGEMFSEAIQANMPVEIVEEIHALSEWRIILLPAITNYIRAHYTIYTMQPNASYAMRYMLLWKPTLQPEAFHFGYSSDQVKYLQERLHKLGLYTFEPDGIVGSKTIAALAHFQRNNGLIPTGTPDLSVLFLLEQANQYSLGESVSKNTSFFFRKQVQHG
ncbi:MAG: AAA family ATPase [Mariprofundaceae bacterium]